MRNELFELNDSSGRDIGTANVARTRHQGLEAGVEIELLGPAEDRDAAGRLTLRQEYTLNDFRFDHDPVHGTNRLAGIPIHLYELDLMFRGLSGFYLGSNLICNLTRFPADHANTLHADAYTIAGFKGGYQGKRFSLFFEIRNLADRRYAAIVRPIPDARTSDDEDLAIFAPGAGRSFFTGFTVAW